MTDTTKGHFRSHWGFYTMLLLMSGLLGYVWINGQTELNALAEIHQAEVEDIYTNANSILSNNASQSRELTTKAIIWAITDSKEIDIKSHFTELVKYKGIEEVALIDTKGSVTISTNLNNLDKSQINAYSVPFSSRQTEIKSIKKDGHTIVTAPLFTNGMFSGMLIQKYEDTELK